jgi:phosphatidylserine/phosphatidylglycerophosphate/cardiolipin synthase-like enzyme
MRYQKTGLSLVIAGLALVQWLLNASREPDAPGVVSARNVQTQTPRQIPAGAISAEVLAVAFTPPSGGGQVIVKAIDDSRDEVLVQAYGFTHNAIAQALLRAQQRGVKVQVLLDKKSSQTNRYVIDLLEAASLPVKFDGAHAIAHNKVMVIDASVVVTGSYNFTNSADTRNAENILVLRSPDLAKSYRDNWQAHWSHGQATP